MVGCMSSHSFTTVEVKSTKRVHSTFHAVYLVIVCAPWLDIFDQARTFGLRIPIMARESPVVSYALSGLAARQLERQSAV